MLIVACKCLNITANIACDGDPEKDYFGPLDNAVSGTVASFLKDCIGPFCNPSQLIIKTKHTELLARHSCSLPLGAVGKGCQWTLTSCINCEQIVYGNREADATATEPFGFVFNGQLLTSMEAINKMQLDERYSKIYQVVIRRSSPAMLPSRASPLSPSRMNLTMDPKLKGLSALLNEQLHRATEETEERIRAFTEQQFEALRVYRAAAELDYLTLAEKLNIDTTSLSSQVFALPTTSTDHSTKPISSPVVGGLLLETPPLTPDSGNGPANSPPALVKAASVSSAPQLQGIPAEGQLQFGDMDEFFPNIIESGPVADLGVCNDDEVNDVDEDEEDTAEEATENLFAGRCIPRVEHSASIAKSLPIPTPIVPIRSREDANEVGSNDNNVDIAASIKALASVHRSDLIFGDLPRPRLGTQI